jgi:biopolymer transport protein TolR
MRKRTPSMSPPLNSNINVTPMADVILVLLIIFMIATPVLQKNDLAVPVAQNPLEVKSKKPLVLSLTRDGHIYLGKTPVTEQNMTQALSEQLAGKINQAIFIRADYRSSYGKVVQIVNECSKAGIQRIGLLAEPEMHRLH